MYNMDDAHHGKSYDATTAEFVNSIFEEDWDEYVEIDDENQIKHRESIALYLEDPNLIFENVDDKKHIKHKRKQREGSSVDKPLKGKYNISCDKYYCQEAKTKNSLGTFGVQHSLPALKLDPAFYKTNHTKEELRNFHRPLLNLCGLSMKLQAVNDTGHKMQSIIKKAGEFTLKDSCCFSLFEYSEEDPFFVANPGMVSLLNIYYRKNSVRDEYVPDHPHYTILDAEDSSPFLGFGDVAPGSSMLALENNLFIAPIFKHSSSDYLCIVEGSTAGKGTCFFKSIENLYCVGQQFPLEEVYAPHSRKLNLFCKNRLKVAAFRLFNSKDGRARDLKISQLDEMFPYFSEGSKRKWLKEYADCAKKGRDNVWVLRPSSSLLSEEDLRKFVIPENICQYESMLAGERRLQDSGYKVLAESDDEENEEENPPPWCLSRNFVNACNGRGLLELNGPGDPTGIGEGFSFRKIRLKKGNEIENRKIINEHQSRYKEEISRIWNKQLMSLSSTENIMFDESFLFKKQGDDMKSVDVLDSATMISESAGLMIKRIFSDGESTRTEIEKIYDSKVIKAYLRTRKKSHPEEKKGVLTCGNCGQAGHMKTNKACPNFMSVRKMTKKKIEAERRKARSVLQDIMLKLLHKFFQVPYSVAFHKPVSVKKFPDYPLVVSNPIDLTTIKTKVRHNKYRKFCEFLKDFELMHNNCCKYNGEEHSLTRISGSILEFCREGYDEKVGEISEAERCLEEIPRD